MSNSQSSGGIASWIWLLVSAAIVVLIAAVWIPEFKDGHRPFMKFASTQGMLTQLDSVECNRTRNYVSMMPVVHFEYSVDGNNYAGDRFVPGNWCANADEVNAALRGLKANTNVTVYYSPKRPEYAVLKVDNPGSGFVAWFLFVALAGTILGYRNSRA
ncbi:MAG: DUF3592 domain-containing protein [Pseudomonadota bacterium]